MKKAITILLSLCTFILVLTACGQKTAKLTGEWTDNQYTIAEIGMQVTLPEDFAVLDAETVQSEFGYDAKDFYRFVARNENKKQLLTCFVLPAKKTDATAYLEKTVENLTAIRESISAITDAEIAGFSFKTVSSTMTNDEGIAMQEQCYVYQTDGKLICFDYSCRADETQNFDTMLTKLS